jgi:hypothetical protein
MGMSWWKKLTGSSPTRRGSELRFPVVVELISGALKASVHVHMVSTPLGEIPCWSYVSDGLRGQQHAEVVITLRREADELEDQFPDDPLKLFALFYERARQGDRVVPGSVTLLGGKRFFGHHLVYARAQPLGDVPLPPSCLTALAVNDEELRAVQTFGLTRVLARMGEACRYYPFPPWMERGRSGLAFAQTFEDSLLAKIGRRASPSLYVVMTSGRVTAMTQRSAQPQWQEAVTALADDEPLAILAELDEGADSCLVWQPGQRDPFGIAMPGGKGERTSGCFLAFISGQPEDGALLIEDGFVLQLTSASWTALRRALSDGTDLSIPTTGAGMPFALEWLNECYVSPIDGAVYSAAGGWRRYQPGENTGAHLDRLVAPGDGIRLLTAEATIAARCSASDLGAFCQEVRLCMARTLAQCDGPAKILVRVTCTPEGHRFELASEGRAPRVALQSLHDALGSIAKLPVRTGEVVFEITLTAAPSA